MGIFGGSFDPVHLGHLILALDTREALELDEVWLVPAARTPLKARALAASAADRLSMLELAVRGLSHIEVWPGELERGGTSYTVETARLLKERYPDCAFTFILGADRFSDFAEWREPEVIAELMELAVLQRGNTPVTAPDGLPANLRWRTVSERILDISSTEIRERKAAGRRIDLLVPPAVSHYINEHNLYHQEPSNRAESLNPAYGSRS